MIHEGHDSVRGHRGRVKPGGGEERSHVERHGALRSVQNEKFTPGESEERHLIRDLEIRKERDVPRPFHRTEEQTGRQLADVLNAHDVTRLHALVSISGGWIWLGPKQEGYVSGQVALATQRVSVGQRVMARVLLIRRHSTSLNRYQNRIRRRRNVHRNNI